ncbi:MAG: dTDP-4-dehydrorhamnose reductase [Solirubrobacteraceae bacterium]|jgi:dTDP-4-dehydrorhamnose reductase
MSRILVAGAAGMLGRDVVTRASERGYDVIAVDLPELDITDQAAVARMVADRRPVAIINCAAWTDVDGAETHEAAALELNGAAAGNLARAASAHDALLVHVSTDYVFDGAAATPYVESDAPAPQTAYGRTKLAGERAVALAGSQHAIVRTAWLFGPGGRNFVATMLALAAERDEVAVVADQIGCPTYSGHLAGALLDLAEQRSSGIHHVAGGGQCSWSEFASEIFAQAGSSCKVRPVASSEFPRPAPRPAWSVLVSERPETPRLPPWRDGLAEYLAHASQAVGR